MWHPVEWSRRCQIANTNQFAKIHYYTHIMPSHSMVRSPFRQFPSTRCARWTILLPVVKSPRFAWLIPFPIEFSTIYIYPQFGKIEWKYYHRLLRCTATKPSRCNSSVWTCDDRNGWNGLHRLPNSCSCRVLVKRALAETITETHFFSSSSVYLKQEHYPKVQWKCFTMATSESILNQQLASEQLP